MNYRDELGGVGHVPSSDESASSPPGCSLQEPFVRLNCCVNDNYYFPYELLEPINKVGHNNKRRKLWLLRHIECGEGCCNIYFLM